MNINRITMDFAILNCAKLYQIFRKSVIGDISVKTNNADK